MATSSLVPRVSPDLIQEARRRKCMPAFRVWCVLRLLDATKHNASGRLTWTETLDHLQHYWSESRAYALRKEGMDLLWKLESIHPHGTHGREEKSLVLVGARALAVTWGLEVLSAYVSRIPLEFCLPPKGQRIHKKNKGVGAWNSLAYHTHLPGPRAPRVRKDGSVRAPHDNHPYSRLAEALEVRSQLPEFP